MHSAMRAAGGRSSKPPSIGMGLSSHMSKKFELTWGMFQWMDGWVDGFAYDWMHGWVGGWVYRLIWLVGGFVLMGRLGRRVGLMDMLGRWLVWLGE